MALLLLSRASERARPSDSTTTVAVVLIAVLLMTDVTVAKLADHGVTPDEVRQVNDGDRIVLRNPPGRRAQRRSRATTATDRGA